MHMKLITMANAKQNKAHKKLITYNGKQYLRNAQMKILLENAKNWLIYTWFRISKNYQITECCGIGALPKPKIIENVRFQ